MATISNVGAGDSGRKVSLPELKELSSEDREELGRLAKIELNKE